MLQCRGFAINRAALTNDQQEAAQTVARLEDERDKLHAQLDYIKLGAAPTTRAEERTRKNRIMLLDSTSVDRLHSILQRGERVATILSNCAVVTANL